VFCGFVIVGAPIVSKIKSNGPTLSEQIETFTIAPPVIQKNESSAIGVEQSLTLIDIFPVKFGEDTRKAMLALFVVIENCSQV